MANLKVIELRDEIASYVRAVCETHLEDGRSTACFMFVNEPEELVLDTRYIKIGEQDWDGSQRECQAKTEWLLAKYLNVALPKWRDAAFLHIGC
jgi:hypothetical protein